MAFQLLSLFTSEAVKCAKSTTVVPCKKFLICNQSIANANIDTIAPMPPHDNNSLKEFVGQQSDMKTGKDWDRFNYRLESKQLTLK